MKVKKGEVIAPPPPPPPQPPPPPPPPAPSQLHSQSDFVAAAPKPPVALPVAPPPPADASAPVFVVGPGGDLVPKQVEPPSVAEPAPVLPPLPARNPFGTDSIVTSMGVNEKGESVAFTADGRRPLNAEERAYLDAVHQRHRAMPGTGAQMQAELARIRGPAEPVHDPFAHLPPRRGPVDPSTLPPYMITTLHMNFSTGKGVPEVWDALGRRKLSDAELTVLRDMHDHLREQSLRDAQRRAEEAKRPPAPNEGPFVVGPG